MNALQVRARAAIIVALCAAGAAAGAERAVQADAIAGSVGVNIHLHYDESIYRRNFPLVLERLSALGVRHVRDALVDTGWKGYYEHHNQLGAAGISGVFIPNPDVRADVLTAYPSRVSDFEMYEFPNEWDNGSDRDWLATLRRFAPVLFNAVGNKPHRHPVVAPSLVHASSFPLLAGLAPSLDYANLHNYFGGHAPGTPGWGNNGYGSIAWNLNNAHTAWPGIPVITTETGYIDDITDPQGLPQTIIATYLPRLIFEQYLHGIHRTYLYELADEGTPLAGLLTADGTPKASYFAVKNLIALLSDPGAPFTTGSLEFELSGDTRNVEHLLAQKRDGTFLLFLWIEKESYNVNWKVYNAIPPQQVTLRLKVPPLRLRMHRFSKNGSAADSSVNPSTTVPLSITDTVLALAIAGR